MKEKYKLELEIQETNMIPSKDNITILLTEEFSESEENTCDSFSKYFVELRKRNTTNLNQPNLQIDNDSSNNEIQIYEKLPIIIYNLANSKINNFKDKIKLDINDYLEKNNDISGEDLDISIKMLQTYKINFDELDLNQFIHFYKMDNSLLNLNEILLINWKYTCLLVILTKSVVKNKIPELKNRINCSEFYKANLGLKENDEKKIFAENLKKIYEIIFDENIDSYDNNILKYIKGNT